jgi:hypothetical protein
MRLGVERSFPRVINLLEKTENGNAKFRAYGAFGYGTFRRSGRVTMVSNQKRRTQ